MIKAIVFDCFGVLVNDGLQALTDEILADRTEDLHRVHGLVMRANRGLVMPGEYDHEIERIFGISHDEYQQRIRTAEVKNEALLEYILELRKNYKTALLSNISNQASLDRRFSPVEIKRYFDTAVLSGVEGYAKPEAQIYEIAADRLGRRLDECVFTDDRAEYCDGGRAVGMQAIEYESFEQFREALDELLQTQKTA